MHPSDCFLVNTRLGAELSLRLVRSLRIHCPHVLATAAEMTLSCDSTTVLAAQDSIDDVAVFPGIVKTNTNLRLQCPPTYLRVYIPNIPLGRLLES